MKWWYDFYNNIFTEILCAREVKVNKNEVSQLPCYSN